MSLEKLKKNTINSRPLVCFEVNPPKGCDVSKIFEKLDNNIEGIDFFNVTDNALARVKMAAIPFSSSLKNRYGIETLVNITCRDRNSIALQSDLLSANLLGINSVIALTGDALSVGDNPETKAVFEMNSTGLLQLIVSLNNGIEKSGKKLNQPTNILPGCVVNPNAKNVDAEIRKLEKKIASGAVYALSQPVFDIEIANTFIEKTKDLDIRILLGLMPFGNANAIIGVQKVPGIKISDKILQLVESSEQVIKDQSIKLSLEIVKESIGKVAGYHIISGANTSLALELTKQIVKMVK